MAAHIIPRVMRPAFAASTTPASADMPRRVRILQFNTLADGLSDAFPLVEKRLLSWPHRSALLLQEILAHDPDIACLQEVDHFDDFFESELAQHGYTGIFKPKRDDGKADGCATFFKRSKFEVHIRQDLEYRKVIDDKDVSQVAILTVFKPAGVAPNADGIVSREGLFAVLNTHLKAKDEFEATRVKEVSAVLDVLAKLQAQFPRIPMVISSDMNTEPTGPVYELLEKGLVSFSGSSYTHRLSLKSAYALYKDGGGEPDYTTWKIRPPVEVARVIDYLWYTPETLLPIQLLALPGPETLPPTRLPSENYPSDHFALLAEFGFLPASM
ncbi:hypothetical protein CAOG_00687 [Capsaspora owczarzaki ATCC 30864]|uniref:Endonuclease/exonuclease/phosphatase domain-containing protein n=1 Tax=Capsaspora owczarzaki (strain ATCC 30864) TaxID=595528 RepID=A0A0D2WJ07_CAPO3|nr:hypothetical protein CAOG_00687 [Capsaspora owczarzaki ATCC 30864]KJE89158.1 hypothetical protein CAOG_000687 [Capsaspora owczarzaki ATCC 30864]|eukprot:XP_004365558.1 hypothetical protein CAOG_00687 [Capsaspora owczarzaki ATCC 30864]